MGNQVYDNSRVTRPAPSSVDLAAATVRTVVSARLVHLPEGVAA